MKIYVLNKTLLKLRHGWSLVILLSKILNIRLYNILTLKVLMKVISEARRVHWVWYLRFCKVPGNILRSFIFLILYHLPKLSVIFYVVEETYENFRLLFTFVARNSRAWQSPHKHFRHSYNRYMGNEVQKLVNSHFHKNTIPFLMTSILIWKFWYSQDPI